MDPTSVWVSTIGQVSAVCERTGGMDASIRARQLGRQVQGETYLSWAAIKSRQCKTFDAAGRTVERLTSQRDVRTLTRDEGEEMEEAEAVLDLPSGDRQLQDAMA